MKSLGACLLLATLAACSEQVPLGSWGGEIPTACGGGGTPGSLNAPGSDLAVTVTNTDYTWPAESDAMDIDVVVESQHERDGYFWAYQFNFASGQGGFIGLQARGGYQANPPSGSYQTANMAVFWISGPPEKAELGDLKAPSARTWLTTERGAQWWTIHALYDFDPCRSYRWRVARQALETNGDIWYGAWIRDNGTGVDTYLGRILVPAEYGRLSTSSSAFSNRIGWGAVTSCSFPEHASARFSTPRADGVATPYPHTNRFASPTGCGTSRFTDIGDSVRQELSVPASN